MDTAAKTKMKSSQRDELWTSLISLAECCPVNEGNPEDCLLFRVRKMKPSARLNWLDGLAKDDLSFIAAYHHICLNVRLVENRIA